MSVGQVAGGLIGGIAGFLTGGTAAFAFKGLQYGFMIGGWLTPPKGPTINGPRLSDLSVQTSTYGVDIPRVYGASAINGNVIWLENNKLTEVVKKKKSGGKGGSKQTVKTYTYFATFAVGLCRGPISGVRRIWIGPDLFYDAGSDDLDSILASNKNSSTFRIYNGTEDQQPDSRMQATLGVANTPSYRGLAYIVLYDLELTKYGNSLSVAQVKVEVVKSQTETLSLLDTQTMINSSGIGWSKNPGVVYVGNQTFTSNIDVYEYFKERRTGLINYDPDVGTVSMIREAYDVGSVALDCSINTVYIPGIGEFGPHGALYAQPNHVAKRGDSIYIAGRTAGNAAYCFIYTTGGQLVNFFEMSELSYDIKCQGDEIIAVKYASSTFYAKIYDNTFNEIESITIAGGGTPVSGQVALAHKIGRMIYVATTNGTNTTLHQFDLDALSVSSVALPGNTSAYLGTARSGFIAFSHNMFAIAGQGGGNSGVVYWNRKQGSDKVLLSDIVTDECELSGLITSADIDVSSLTDEVTGYMVSRQGAIRGAIEPLQAAYPFDIVQSGYKIKFIRRGSAGSVATIPLSDLDARGSGGASGVSISKAREMDIVLPSKVSIIYADKARDYDQVEQFAARIETDSVNKMVMEIPLVMTADEAAKKADTLLYMYWLERYDVKFNLPPTYANLEPSDVVTIDNMQCRITAINYTSDGRLECDAKLNDSAVYVSVAEGEEPPEGTNTITYGGPSSYVLIDTVCVDTAQNSYGYIAAMTGLTDAWPGGYLYESRDSGTSWEDIQAFAGPVPIGIASNALATKPSSVIDASSVLDVEMMSGDLFSVTELQMLNGANHFAYGADGRWEIIAAKNCVLQMDGTYKLYDMLRGRFGTEHNTGNHAVGDYLVYLPDSDIAFIGANSSDIGATYQYKGITAYDSIESGTVGTFAYQAQNLKPLAPVYLNGNRHPTTNNWTLTWIRRTRIDGAWLNFVDAGLGETTESYEVDIFSNSSYTVLKRTIAVTAQTASYTSAQQVTDFGSNQSTLYVKIYQLSASVGRGNALTASITR